MIQYRFTAAALLCFTPALASLAEDAPPPPQGVFIGKGQFGFLDSRGNSVSESINANLDVMRYDGAWKNELYLGGLYGKNGGILSAERWALREQTDYNFTPDWFGFGGLRYSHDLFDGFVYQASLTAGAGYKVINSNDTKLSVQAGVGYRRLRPESVDKDPDGVVISRTPLQAKGDAIGTVGVDFSHAFNKSTSLTNKFLVEAGSSDTLLHDDIALAVKMSTKLALSIGYGIIDNTKPTPPAKKIDTVTSVNLVYAF